MLTETKNNVPQKESGTYDGIKKFLSGGYINGIGKAKADVMPNHTKAISYKTKGYERYKVSKQI